MTNFQTAIIILMKCAITGETMLLPEGFSLEEVETFASKQHITTLIYNGAIQCGISTKEPVMQRMLQRYVQMMMRSERQMADVMRIFHIFNENRIEYLPLKGCNMKRHYPKSEMRFMGDADILIRVDQYDRIQSVMTELGFTEGPENLYEYHWNNANIHIEFHKTLISPEKPEFHAYWANVWDRVQRGYGTGYALSSEDEFLFMLTHIAKHYRGHGVGCRYMLDLWVFLRAYPELNKSYIEEELEKLQLLTFYHRIQRLLSVWFEGNESDNITDFMTEFVFFGGSWGSWETEILSKAVNNKRQRPQKKILLVITKMFPPLSVMTRHYPLLEKVPILLPLCWVLRLLRTLFADRKKRRRGFYVVTDVSNENIMRYKTHMQDMGLYFTEE